MTHQHTITITVTMTESLAEAQKQGVVDMLDDDVDTMLQKFEKLHSAEDAYGAPVCTDWKYTIDSEDTP